MRKNYFKPVPATDCNLNNLKLTNPDRPAVYVSKNMTGKMEGILAISTSVLFNPFCQARAGIPGSICAKCYAGATVARYNKLREHVEDNYILLNHRDLLPEELPVICSDVCRLEAFGDLASATQARNYLRIAYKNPWCVFAIWTKNPEFLNQAIEELGKPTNLICILSSMYVNKVEDGAGWPWVDKVFTVYDAKTIDAQGVEINCGGRKCRECMRCYSKENKEYYISEKLK